MAAMVVGLALGFSGTLRAQYPMPGGYGPFPGGPGPQDPTPLGAGVGAPMPPPGGVPTPADHGGTGFPAGSGGPIAPGGPPTEFKPPELSSTGPNAWQGDTWNRQSAWYVSGGALALHPTSQPSALISTLSVPLSSGVNGTFTTVINVPITFVAGNGQVTNATVPVPVTYTAPIFNTETGNPFLSGAPQFGNYSDLHSDFMWGGKAALGFVGPDNSSVEFSGFYIPKTGPSEVIRSPQFVVPTNLINVLAVGTIPSPGGAILSVGNIPQAVAAQLPGVNVGRLNLPFTNAPTGFGGDHGLWTEADRVTVSNQSALANAEANYRLPVDGIFQPLVGIRYLDQSEWFANFTEDDAFTNPQATTNATYAVHTHNRFITGQLGMEVNLPATRFLQFNAYAKGAWGANIMNSDVSLVRGDGLVGFDGHRNTTYFGQIYEVGAFLDFYFLQRGRIHAGYQGIWLPRITHAFDQLDYNLAHTTGTGDDKGHEFYHGPVFELQFLF
jgi:hypothetical protein